LTQTQIDRSVGCCRLASWCGLTRTPIDFITALKDADIRISMDGKGAWRDNVFVERLWRDYPKFRAQRQVRQRMGCRKKPIRYPVPRTVQQVTRFNRMGQSPYTKFRIVPRPMAWL